MDNNNYPCNSVLKRDKKESFQPKIFIFKNDTYCIVLCLRPHNSNLVNLCDVYSVVFTR